MIRYYLFTLTLILGIFGALFVYRGVAQCELLPCATEGIAVVERTIAPIQTSTLSLRPRRSIPRVVQPPVLEEPITMFFAGDLMLGRDVGYYLGLEGESAIFAPYFATRPTSTLDVDLFMVNLEGPFSTLYRSTTKEIAFRFDPRYLPLVKRMGITHVSLANNHTLDMGYQGLADTTALLERYDIHAVGKQLSYLPEDMWFEETINGQRVGYLAIDDVTVSIPQQQIIDFIVSKDSTVDHLIVQIHWGEEYALVHNDRQQQLAHAFIDAGADVIIGHHPHVVQGIEVYNKRPIIYSLGNFVFDQYFSEETQQGMTMKLTLTDEEYIVEPFFTDIERVSVRFVEGETATERLNDVIDRSLLDVYRFRNGKLSIPQ